VIGSAFLSGWYLAGNDRSRRTVLSLGTAQRNMSAALVVAQSNFVDPNVTVMCMVGGILMLGGLLLAARMLARQA
jgi:BASS family bile acid:Na+ symporter